MIRILATILTLFAVTASAEQPSKLKVDVFTASPGGFLATSTIVSGEKEAILIDAQFTLAEAHRLAARVLESGKTLKAIYITHAHPDHFFGLEVLKAQFPRARILASKQVIREMKAITAAKHGYWKPIFGDNLTRSPLFPVAFDGTALELEGNRLELIAIEGAESDAATVVWIPSVKTVVAGDLVYEGVHAWLADAATPARREAWLENLAKLKALNPTLVVAGHRGSSANGAPSVLDDQAQYLRDFSAAVKASTSAADVVKIVSDKHPRLELPIVLDVASKAAFPDKS